jgi:mycothiol synthase
MSDRLRDVHVALRGLEDPEDGAAAPVDEDEHRRLTGTVPVQDRAWSWDPSIVRSDGIDLAYVGVRSAPSPPAEGAPARRYDVTLRRAGVAEPVSTEVLRGLLEDVRSSAPGSATELWLRGATTSELAVATELGFPVTRTLRVLRRPEGTSSPDRDGTPLPPGITVRRGLASDVPLLARLFAAVYPEGAEAWDEAALAIRRTSPWFRDGDVLLAIDPVGAVVAVHWMKRRDPTTGEVHNLAVHPDHQGIGLGPAMLDLGLAHLRAVGCEDVLLWADAENVTALALYASRGFLPAWDDAVLTPRPR